MSTIGYFSSKDMGMVRFIILEIILSILTINSYLFLFGDLPLLPCFSLLTFATGHLFVCLD